MSWHRRVGIAAGIAATVFAGITRAATPVILISVDTLRADRLGVYGYKGARTPNIDALARNGTLFAQAGSQIPLTLPSHTSLFTSSYPFETEVEENGERVPSAAVTLASVLQAHGYKTAAFIGSCLLNREMGLSRGFDFYDSPFSLQSGVAENPYSLRVRRDGALVVRAARQWLDANRGETVFAFIHLFDLHTPYSAPAAAGRTGSAAYDAELEYADQAIGRLRQALEQGGWWERSLVILLADHGESLGDHGEASHGYFIYQSTLRVPLIVHWPPNSGEHPARVEEPVGLIDVAPTVLGLLHIAAPPSFHGVNLMNAVPQAVYSESMYTRDAFQWAPLRGLRVGSHVESRIGSQVGSSVVSQAGSSVVSHVESRQYIRAPRAELYDLQADPGELTNIAAANAPEAHSFEEQLGKLLAQFAPKRSAPGPDILPLARGALESLGYLGGGAHTGGRGAGPDPKDKLAEYNLYEKALAALYGGRPDSAIAGFRAALAEGPHNTLARYYLGDAYLRSGKPDDALREWTAALAFDPEYAPADEAIGALWLARQDYARARSFFEQALAVAPQDYAAQLELGMVAQRQGQFKEALQRFETACKAAPEDSECGQPLQALREKAK
jgi:choline-sulfatase